jgi:hypothetical protein
MTKIIQLVLILIAELVNIESSKRFGESPISIMSGPSIEVINGDPFEMMMGDIISKYDF